MSKKCYFASVVVLLIYIFICCISSTSTNVSKTKYLTEKVTHNTTPLVNKSDIKNTSSDKNINDYIGKLVIKELNINNYIYDFNSSKNTVEKNVEILDGSILPDNNNSSIIFLAAHSGNGKIAYFKNLDKLKIGDEIYFYYNNYKYIYQAVDIFEITKDGDIELNKISDNQLVLTTCSPNNSDMQLVVNSKLIRKES